MTTHLEQYRRIRSIAQAGLYYGKDEFDQERYKELSNIAFSLINSISDETIESVQGIFALEEGYPTPKVDVRAFITKNDEILLVEDKWTKEWSLPGGYAEIGLTPKENIFKEVLEETGLTVHVDKLMAVFDTNLRKDIPQIFQYYKMVFGCSVASGAFAENIETSDIRYFSVEDLPVLSEKRTTAEQLKRLMVHPSCFFD